MELGFRSLTVPRVTPAKSIKELALCANGWAWPVTEEGCIHDAQLDNTPARYWGTHGCPVGRSGRTLLSDTI
jgi:hypothetical protein